MLNKYQPRNDDEKEWLEWVKACEDVLSPGIKEVLGLLLENSERWEMRKARLDVFEKDGCILGQSRDRILELIGDGLRTGCDLDDVIVGQGHANGPGTSLTGLSKSKIIEIWSQIERQCRQNLYGQPPERQHDFNALSILSTTFDAVYHPDPPKILPEHRVSRWHSGDDAYGPDDVKYYVTSTQAGYITSPHYDSPVGLSYIWHIAGAKMWLVWESVEENWKIIKRSRASGEVKFLPNLQWAIEHLKGLKVCLCCLPVSKAEISQVYFLRTSSRDKTWPLLLLEPAAFHAVFSLTTSVHIGSYLLTPTRKDLIMRVVKEMSEQHPCPPADQVDVQNALSCWSEMD